MAIRDGERHKAYLGPPLCSAQTRQLAYDFIARNHAARRLRPVEGVQGDLVETYASILGLDQEHVAATYPVVIRRADGAQIPARFQRAARG